MAVTLALDVYGTLIDTAGISDALRPRTGAQTAAFAQYWREQQLEYTFRRALMRCYRDFEVCTRQALDYTCARFGIELDAAFKDGLMALYRCLPAFPDAVSGLAALHDLPVRLYAFSNGRAEDIASLLGHAGIAGHFADIISLAEVPTYKPDPAAYAHFHRRANTAGGETWLISSNPFDVIGATACGLRSVWIRRSAAAIFDPWEIQPTLTCASMDEVAAHFGRSS